MKGKRVDIGPGGREKIAELMAAGKPLDQISAEMGLSRATTARRMREAKELVPGIRAQKRQALPAPLPKPEDVPESTPLEQIAIWLSMAKEEVDAARSAGDTDMMQKMVRLATALLALQQKATPEPPPDPNKHPDFVEAAETVRKRWRSLLEKL